MHQRGKLFFATAFLILSEWTGLTYSMTALADSSSLQFTVTGREWCRGNLKFSHPFNIKPPDGATLTFTRDAVNTTAVQATLHNTGIAEIDTLTMKGHAFHGNKTGSADQVILNGALNNGHFVAIRGKAIFDQLGNLIKITGDIWGLVTDTYAINLQDQSGPVDCFFKDTFVAKKVASPPPPKGSSFVNATLQAYLKASNTEGQDFFGNYVALDGDTLAIGAYQEDSCATGINGGQTNGCSNSGAVYVFTRTGGVWTQQAYLKASNTGPGDRFGFSLALSGDTLAVAAFEEASCGISGSQANNDCGGTGAVYVFTRTAGIWTQQAYLKDTTYDISGEHFGQSVSLQGDTLAVGAMFEGLCSDGSTCTGSGAVFVFTRAGVVWTKQVYLKASNVGVNDNFGSSVALEGDTLAVGAYSEDSCATGINGDTNNNDCGAAGAVYVFNRTGGLWTQQAYLKASNTNADDRFGHTIALKGDTLAVAASGEDSCATGINGDQSSNVCGQAGAVYIFTRTAGVWNQQAYLKASNTGFNPNFPDSGDRFGGVQTGNVFGVSVAFNGDRLAVGAWEEDSCATGINGNQADNGCGGAGAVYIFTRIGSTWSQEAYVKASNANTADAFGFAVAISDNTLAVGALGEGSCATGTNGDQTPLPGCDGSGAVYIYVKP